MKVRSVIRIFFGRKENEATLFTITDIAIYLDGMHYQIVITSYRPGIIIGKAGKDIGALRDYLNEEIFSFVEDTDITFEIVLKECKLWTNV